MTNICILGASTSWSPGLVTDLMTVFREPLEIRFIDINPKNARLCAEWAEAAGRHFGRRRDRYLPFTDRRKALKAADAVIITLSTGGLDAMEQDIKIPEKYGIFATVGDTAGPGGWSRSIRNIPVFREFADDFQRFCPTAFIANYTNPMSQLTATLQLGCGNPSVGLCHSYFGLKDIIKKIFGLKDWNQIGISIAGVNHFIWAIDFKLGRQDGYALLRKKIGQGSLADVLPRESADEIGIFSGHKLCVELYDAFGYLPYPGDRHTSEFVSFAMAGNVKRYKAKGRQGEPVESFRYCDIRRTSVDYRRKELPAREQRIRDMISGKAEMPEKSRETGVEMIHAHLYNRPFCDAVNCLNKGQVPGAPLDACVETLGVVDGLGVHPLLVTGVPENILELFRTHAVVQKWTVQGALKGDKNLLLQALYRDPQCSHLKPHEIRRMADELLTANRAYFRVKE